MIAIAGYTMRRMKEPACILLVIIGCFLAAFLGGSTPLEMPMVTEAIAAHPAATPTIGMGILLAFVLIFGIFIAATDIPRECHSRCISFLLSKPIRRGSYVRGKFLGLFGLAYLLYLLFLTVLAVFSWRHFPSWNAFLRAFGSGVIAGWYLAPVLAVAVAWSVLVDDVPSVLLTALYVALSLGLMFIPFLRLWFSPAVTRLLFAVHLPFANPLYFVFPHTAPRAIGWLLLYAGSGALLFCSLATVAFERKDISAGRFPLDSLTPAVDNRRTAIWNQRNQLHQVRFGANAWPCLRSSSGWDGC